MEHIRKYIRYPLNVAFVVRVWLNYYIWTIVGPFFGQQNYEKRLRVMHKEYSKQFFDRAIRYRGLLIKIGQIISSRPDIMPAEYIKTLSKLQDRIPPAEYDAIKKRIEHEFSLPLEDVFPTFDPKALASASLGQVHEARLPNGDHVAVKIQYPGIEDIVQSDLKVMWIALVLFSMWKKLNIKVLYDEFRRVLLGELNYEREARFAIHFRELFGEEKNVVSPHIYVEQSTSKVLTMEFVKGEKISDFAAREKDKERRKRVVKRLVEVYSSQIFQYGFFHADPHPGNIFISDNDEIVFVDFGICSELDAATREGLRQMARSVVDLDIESMLAAARKLGIISLDEDERRTRELLVYAINEYKDMSPQEFKESEKVGEWVENVYAYLQEAKSFQIPHRILLFLRTISILEGHLATLDPHLNLLQLASPYIRKFVMDDKSNAELVLDSVKEFFKTIYRLPREAERFLQRTNRAETFVRTSDVSFEKLVALLPTIFFAMLTMVLFVGIPVMAHLDLKALLYTHILLTPFSFILTVLTYRRGLKR
ncbi:MAG: AarF/UbiB family protein [Planctomycetota bacterium]|nr:AarF/UbiB family protein [Planctomycetota bacterium]